MKAAKSIVSIFFILFYCLSLNAQEPQPRELWTITNPFEQKVLIENKGQYTLPGNEKVEFGTKMGGLHYYFTNNSIVIKKSTFVKRKRKEVRKALKQLDIKDEAIREEVEEKELSLQRKDDFYTIQFEGNNSQTQIIPSEKVDHYYTWGSATEKVSDLKALAYKKITWKNLYPGIDMEFYFPEDKEGYKYNFIIHPGANTQLIKMNFISPGLKKMIGPTGDIILQSSLGQFIEHAPLSFQQNVSIHSNYKINGMHVGFEVGEYDKTKTLIIDPWTITPVLPTTNKAFDVDWDNAGNVYVYGGIGPDYKLNKYTAAGNLLWTYTAVFTSQFGYYGDFAVDRKSQSVYITDGFNSAGAQVHKVGLAGTQTASFYGHFQFAEMWRIAFSPCTNHAIIAGGGVTNPSCTGTYLDTTLVSLSPVNVLNSGYGLHDMWGMALDKNGNCYMATAQAQLYPNNFDNIMVKIPIPALTPQMWNVKTGYKFVEVASQLFCPVQGSNLTSNAFNGMTVNNTALYTYDSFVLKKWNTTNGALLGSKNINGTSKNTIMWGGITVDDCDHLFLGSQKNVLEFDANLNQLSSITAQNTVYDVVLGAKNILYVCGNGFLSTYQLGFAPCTGSLVVADSVQHVKCGQTIGQAGVTASGGVSPYMYSWSTTPAQTTNTATGLVPGTYVVTITDNSCPPITMYDTIEVKQIGSTLLVNVSTNASICEGDSVLLQATASGGLAPYTYTWAPGNYTDSSLWVQPTTSTNYIVTVNDNCGSTAATDTISITVFKKPVAEFNINPIANAEPSSPAFNFVDASINAATWHWSFGDPQDTSTSTIQNPSHTYAEPDRYCTTLIVASSDGCTDTTQHCVESFPEWAFYVPNSFTPNNDGKNDVFIGKGEGISEFEMWIYDRWGNEICHSKSLTQPWDGKVQNGASGKLAQQDVYVWIMDITTTSKIQKRITGHVSLLR